jgi:hypothetical protein
MVGAYLNELGLSEEAIVYITSAEPRSMRWLTTRDAVTFGIELGRCRPQRAATALGSKSGQTRRKL